MGNYIQTNWSGELRPYNPIEVRITEGFVQYVNWFDMGKDPSIIQVKFSEFKDSEVERSIISDFGSDIYEEVCKSIEALKKI